MLALFAAGALAVGLAAPAVAVACELRAVEHRSGREVLRAPLLAPQAAVAPAAKMALQVSPAPASNGSTPAPELRVNFVHSVLGTPVEDRYLWRDGGWLLVEERFEGTGYGLPHAAGPGERLERTAEGWRLLLARPVEPLVVRPLLAQRMRLTLDGGRTWLLGQLSTQAVELLAEGC